MPEMNARNIVLLPTGDAAEQCRAWSATVADRIESHIDLRRADMLPHLSLYNTAFPAGSDDALIEKLRTFATTRKPFDVRLVEAAIVHGYVFANAEISKDIDAIHRAIIDALNPIRDGGFDPSALQLKLSDRERERLEQTGMILSLEGFLPHVTLARPIDPASLEQALSLVPDVGLTFRADAIHLVESGPNGTCKRTIESFPLSA